MNRLAILFVALCCIGANAAAQSETHVTVLRCKQGGCPIPPMPPVPPTPPSAPTPPVAPVPPLQPMASLPELPPLPAMPAPPPAPPMPPMPPMPHMPPAPPAPPVLPTVPDGAHAACADKAPGYALTWVIRKGEVMMGNCERYKGKMMFTLQSYHRQN